MDLMEPTGNYHNISFFDVYQGLAILWYFRSFRATFLWVIRMLDFKN